MKIAIMELYCGKSGQIGYYNSQEMGIAKAYAKLGHEVLVVFPRTDIIENRTENFTDKITVLYIYAKAIGVHAYYKLSFLLEMNIDLVHLDADNQMFASHVVRYCSKNRIKYYCYVGTLYSDSDNRMKQRIMKFFSRQNIRCYKKSTVFAKTQYVAEELKTFNVKNVQIVPVGLDLEVIPTLNETKEEIRKRLFLPLDRKIVLFVGRLEKYKRPLEALELLETLGKSYLLIMIGDGSLSERIEEEAKSRKIRNDIIFIRRIMNREIHQYYKASDCLVNFNEKEIFGMNILEAMYQGCPIVARHAPGPDMIVEDGVSGYLCDDVAQQSIRVGQVNEQMGIKAKQIILQKFDWNCSVKLFVSR